ncbi:hypothetical protein [Thermomonospora amylolytica]|uniref:hypothetical protein n=1 Tax=Thermomonospora amylolytica TaxID=1411117 RepID=UPI001300A6E2|nr:hypothetical protein [Thermomonospora amylolytica]
MEVETKLAESYRTWLKEMENRAVVQVVEVSKDTVKLNAPERFGDQAFELPTLIVLAETRMPLDRLPGMRFSAIVTEIPDYGISAKDFRALS